ncbi:carboxymuconolactone decarboxylase family protein [Mycobacteroides abscessus]|uniref:carboxymuconolactone decarboxylase family protein n=1 Tax=Mycobacteroides abscessus TaxID=36809 RepID=UPI000C26762D|nr:carboxymuconolactone decarboxylase family protein [Mycobacteroides abscessus]
MARIPYPRPADIVPATLQPVFGHQINIFRMTAHSPLLFTLFHLYSVSLLTHAVIDKKDRELVILACAKIFSSDYEWCQHLRTAPAAGVTDVQLDALVRKEFDSAVFTRTEQALLAVVAATARDGAVHPHVLERFLAHFSRRELIEVLALVGNYFTIARISTVLDIEIDPPSECGASIYWQMADGLTDHLMAEVAEWPGWRRPTITDNPQQKGI